MTRTKLALVFLVAMVNNAIYDPSFFLEIFKYRMVHSSARWFLMQTEAKREKHIIVSYTREVKIPFKRIWDLLVTAFEGGSNYWIRYVELTSNPENLDNIDAGFDLYNAILNKGGSIKIVDDDGGTHVLDVEKAIAGLQKFKAIHEKEFFNFIEERDDADTGDAFLQACLFGEIVYG